jgi:hypothetical protein
MRAPTYLYISFSDGNSSPMHHAVWITFTFRLLGDDVDLSWKLRFCRCKCIHVDSSFHTVPVVINPIYSCPPSSRSSAVGRQLQVVGRPKARRGLRTLALPSPGTPKQNLPHAAKYVPLSLLGYKHRAYYRLQYIVCVFFPNDVICQTVISLH